MDVRYLFVFLPDLRFAGFLPAHHGLARVLSRSQTLYIFFGVACLIGVVTGAALHYSSGFVSSVLKLDQAPAQPGRTLARYRAEKQKKQAAKVRMTMPLIGAPSKIDGALKEEYSDWLRHGKGQGQKGLLSTTILEEDDSSEAGF